MINNTCLTKLDGVFTQSPYTITVMIRDSVCVNFLNEYVSLEIPYNIDGVNIYIPYKGDKLLVKHNFEENA